MRGHGHSAYISIPFSGVTQPLKGVQDHDVTQPVAALPDAFPEA